VKQAPVPADLDLSSLDYLPLMVNRLLSSDTWLLATGDEAKAAVTLWCRAWHQVPAGSLPSDDRLLAALSGAGSKWKKVKAVALRGFTVCEDGRLYHTVLCAIALEEQRKRLAHLSRRMATGLRATVFERDKFTCVYCGDTEGPFECDHVIPASRGGTFSLENLATACRDCNQEKGARTPEEWRQ
jgi:hypothetical protein